MECELLHWRRPRHHRLRPAYIRRITLSVMYFPRIDDLFKEFTMSFAQLKWSLPAEDVNDADHVDVFDNGAVVGTVAPQIGEFTTGDLAVGEHVFAVVVRSKAGAEFDSDPSNQAVVVVAAAPVKLTAVSDLTAALA